jgi:hypothetical protein
MYTKDPSGLSVYSRDTNKYSKRKSDDEPLKLLKLLYCEPNLLLAFRKSDLDALLDRTVDTVQNVR